MPILPLPGPSAVLMYRSKSLCPDPQPSTVVDDVPSVSHQTTIHNLQILAKGSGYMAVNVTIDDIQYTGMLFTHNTSNGLPGLFAKAERKKFEDLCRSDAPADAFGIDQWMSSMADRQFVPGRARRSALPNFAKRNDRMICHSCLCIVPEDRSMPFACNCKERQRQRASRLRCGGYQNAAGIRKDRRTTVVAHVNGHPTANGAMNGEEKPSIIRRKTSDAKSSKASAAAAGMKRKMSNATTATSGTSVTKTAKIVGSDVRQLPPQVQSTSAVVNGSPASSEDGVLAVPENKNGLTKFSEYVVRRNDNSPLQITLLKVDKDSLAATADEITTPIQVINDHRKHDKAESKGRKHCHHHSHHGQGSADRSPPPSPRVVQRNSDIGCDPRLRVVNHHTPLTAEPTECNGKPSTSSINKSYVVTDRTSSPDDCYSMTDGCSSKSMTPDRLAAGTTAVRNKRRISLEAKISMIKERILSSPQKTEIDVNKNDEITVCHQSWHPSHESQPVASVSSTAIFASTPYTCSSPLAADLPESVTSTVSALIRAEIYRHETTRGSAIQPAIYPHGITRGVLVWARAPPSAFWPGLVTGVSASTVRVAWCGEHTYNEVDISLVSDFLDTLSVRFAPNAKENRNNKKLCNAVAEALALSRPPLSRLDRRLNIHVTKLLTERYGWDLGAINVFCRGKLVQAGQPPTTLLSSSTITIIEAQPTRLAPIRPAGGSATSSPLPTVTSTTTTIAASIHDDK